jgi:hypothetical protein
MLISMPTLISTIFGVFQAIVNSSWMDARSGEDRHPKQSHLD